MSFTYTAGQSSTLGLGISAKGYDVGYTDSGTEKEWTTDTQGFHKEVQRKVWFRTLFRVALYRQLCVEDGGGRRHQRGQCPKKDKYGGHVVYCLWKARSNGWAGGASTLFPRQAPHTPSFDCVPEPKGDYFARDHGIAVTWSKGFEMTAAGIGFDGQAQTGYDAHGHMDFMFKTKGLSVRDHRPPANRCPDASQVASAKSGQGLW